MVHCSVWILHTRDEQGTSLTQEHLINSPGIH